MVTSRAVGLGVEVWGVVVCVALAEGYDFIGDTLTDEVVFCVNVSGAGGNVGRNCDG